MSFYNRPELFLSHTTGVERFLRYVQIDTTSNAQNSASPSSDGQRILGNKLAGELAQLGLDRVVADQNGTVTATLPGTDKNGLGLIAHLDTAPDCTGAHVSPTVHRSYAGGPLQLTNGPLLRPKENPELSNCVGHDIITSDGTTLLGADDKAGVAIIMAILEYVTANPDPGWPTIHVAFTPDEEIGRGCDHFPYDRFPTDVALTLDGARLGEINFETFEAHAMEVTFTGVSAHPGYAKDKMVNALYSAAAFLENLPNAHRPENCCGKQGFIHPLGIKGGADQCIVSLIIRDFDQKGIKKQFLIVEKTLKQVAKTHTAVKISTKTEFSYPNMHKYVEKKPELIDMVKEAVCQAGLSPVEVAIRGGTDGARLSENGVITPNIFTGAMNIHSNTEWISTTHMGYAFCTVLNIMKLYLRNSK